ncbi:hypothetical protein FUMI01_27450 [Flavobacterium sp. UMI-01]|nr:hypothetical protein FUMI01_27450 [Flavobacterium sp. UMI-01]
MNLWLGWTVAWTFAWTKFIKYKLVYVSEIMIKRCFLCKNKKLKALNSKIKTTKYM